MAQWVGAQGQVKVAKNTPTCGVPPRKPPSKTKIFFDFDYKTCWIRRGFEQLSSSIDWRVIGLQSSAWNVIFAGLKGLTDECGRVELRKLDTTGVEAAKIQLEVTEFQ